MFLKRDSKFNGDSLGGGPRSSASSRLAVVPSVASLATSLKEDKKERGGEGEGQLFTQNFLSYLYLKHGGAGLALDWRDWEAPSELGANARGRSG